MQALRVNAETRLPTLKISFLLIAAVALLAILPTGRLPEYLSGEISDPLRRPEAINRER